MLSNTKHTDIVPTPEAWEVRRKDNDEVLGSFTSQAFAEIFCEAIESLCSDVCEPSRPVEPAAFQRLAA